MSQPSKRISQQELESYLWGAAVLLRGLIDAVAVIDIVASGWSAQDYGPMGYSTPTFDLHLPPQLADGHMRRLHFINACGEPLGG